LIGCQPKVSPKKGNDKHTAQNKKGQQRNTGLLIDFFPVSNNNYYHKMNKIIFVCVLAALAAVVMAEENQVEWSSDYTAPKGYSTHLSRSNLDNDRSAAYALVPALFTLIAGALLSLF
jgi:hypothetical protein